MIAGLLRLPLQMRLLLGYRLFELLAYLLSRERRITPPANPTYGAQVLLLSCASEQIAESRHMCQVQNGSV